MICVKRVSDNKFVSTDIDSSGMSVFWHGTPKHADDFHTMDYANSFIKRLNERYGPNEKFEAIAVVPVS